MAQVIDETTTTNDTQGELLVSDMSDRVSAIGSSMSSTMMALGITLLIVLLVGLAIAYSIVGLGFPPWSMFWLVSLGAAGLRFASSASAPSADRALRGARAASHAEQLQRLR